MENPWTTLQKKQVYENNWIQVEEHDVLNPARNPGIYGVVHFKSLAIGIIPVDQDGNTWLVGQYRYPLQTFTWEIPEGGGDLKISPEESARRELTEETGLQADKMQLILELQTSNSCTDELAYVFMATGLTEGKPHPEENEQIVTRKLPLHEAVSMAIDGRIKDAMSVAGLLKVKVVLGL